MKFEIPDNCSICKNKQKINDKWICGIPPIDKKEEILNLSAFEISLDSRPDWCPMTIIVNKVNNLSEENKILFNKVCDGFAAMFELI